MPVPAAAAEPRLNQIQMIGSHNSYKQRMPADRMAALARENPGLAEALDYAHVPLPEQLDLGVRKLELDVYYDPRGDLFGRADVSAGGGGPPARSAFPVLHVQNLDDVSSCVNLLACLGQLRAWSDAHPRHLPIFVSFNAKDDVIDRPEFLRPLPFAEDAWLALDAELRAVLGDRMITPAEVLPLPQPAPPQWPTLDAARGHFLFVLDEGGDKRREYVARWRERVMFTTVEPGEPGAAILIVNDPVADFARIRALVNEGYIVRTRADADTREARSGDTTRRDAAFASGAQLISTDYYLPETRFDHAYQLQLPGGGVARCNPLAGADCSAAEIR